MTVLRGETTETSEPETEEIHQPAHPGRSIARHLWVLVPILFLSFLLVGLHLQAYPTFSPIDERQHVDYLYRITRGELLRMGEQIGQETLRDEACRGLDWDLFTPPPCHPNRPYNPDIFPNLGYNSAHIHPPTYYFLTSVVAKSFRATGISRNFVSSARLAGGLWLGLALVLFWYAARELQISRVNRIVGSALLATTPTVIYASSTVNPDSMALLAGAALLFTTLVWERKRGRTVLLLPVMAALAVGLKVTNILAVAAGAAYLLVRWWHGRKAEGIEPARERGYLAAASYVAGAGIATTFLWMLLHTMLVRVPFDPAIELYKVDGLSLNAVLSQMLAMVTPVKDAWLSPFFRTDAVNLILQLVNLSLVAAVFGAVFYGRRKSPRTAVATAGGLVILFAGMALTVFNYFFNSRTFAGIPARYGISVLPFLFIALASALRRPVVTWVAGVLAVASVVTVGTALIAAI